jgi:hypothetical protein
MDVTKKVAKSSKNFHCEKCDYITSKKCNYDKHVLTALHQKYATSDVFVTKSDKKVAKVAKNENTKIFTCKFCDKEYMSRNGLWLHNKKCVETMAIETYNQAKHEENEGTIINALSDKHFIMEILQQNKEFKDLLVEQNKLMLEFCKNGANSTHNSYNTMTNSNNKTFNLQFFLNETCKNAMNIMDFVDSLQLQLSDLESIGKLGFVDGLSNIIIKNLKALDVTMRPVHCSDSKRETVYVKHDNKWEKDDETKSKLRKAVKYIAHKNTKLIPQWKANHPDFMDSFSKNSDQYNQLLIEVLGGDTHLHSSVNEDKIIRRIAREMVIDKSM